MERGAGDPVWRSEAPASRIALVAALELEARVPRAALGERSPPVYVSGPGPERAAVAAQRAIAAGARALIAFGLAGGLAAPATSGAVLLPRELKCKDGEWTAEPGWRERLAGCLAPRFALVDLPLFTGDRVLVTPAEKAALAARTGAAAVDMESAAIARAAAEAGIPCVVLRVVADGPDDRLPDGVEALVTAEGRTRFAGLPVFLASPGRLKRLLTLAARSRQAREVLASVVARLAEPGSAAGREAGTAA